MQKTRKMCSLESEYFQWLCDIVQANDPDSSYLILAKILHNIEFYSFVDGDENRVQDGLDLRDQFVDQIRTPVNLSHLSGEDSCTFLEMMVALSIRTENIMNDPLFGDRTAMWFWVMIENLGLGDFTDEYYAVRPFDREARNIVDTVVKRTYRRSGKGGLFPLKKWRKDQRKVEIWYQLNSFLLENYPFDRGGRLSFYH